MNRKNREMIIILSDGNANDQFLARDIRSLGVYSELHLPKTSVEKIKDLNPKGIILTENREDLSRILTLRVPVLISDQALDSLSDQSFREKENELFNIDDDFFGLKSRFSSLGKEKKEKVLNSFLFDLCHCEKNWSVEAYIKEEVRFIQEKVGDKHVLCALSGGVDSSVVAALMHQAIGDQLTCIFVDNGLLRKNETKDVMNLFVGELDVHIIKVDAKDRFLRKLKEVADPEEKRKVIGNEFIQVFSDEASKLERIDYLAQGTLYSDVIESGEDGKGVKSHHNVGGLPEDMEFSLIEPLRNLFKDEVRAVGTALGLPDSIVWRQPFPGPGLAIRILGEVTEEKLEIVRESDAILREEIAEAGLDKEIWQYFTVLPNIRSVGMTDGERTYDHTIGIRAVHSVDGMTSEWAKIPWEVLDKISERIVKEVKHVNRVVYDITSKPPATIEWE